jgi:hypothetical protein
MEDHDAIVCRTVAGAVETNLNAVVGGFARGQGRVKPKRLGPRSQGALHRDALEILDRRILVGTQESGQIAIGLGAPCLGLREPAASEVPLRVRV